MAPGTAIGAATPVDLEGGDLGEEAINDAAALAESVARLRDRNVDFAVDTVRRARSAPAEETLELGAIDRVVGSLSELLEVTDGTEVVLAGDEATRLATAGATVEENDIGVFRLILQWLADPNLGVPIPLGRDTQSHLRAGQPRCGRRGHRGYGPDHPCLALTVRASGRGGGLLLLLAAVLFVAELFAPDVGVFAVLGAVALVLSGLFLFRDVAGLSASLLVMLPTAVLVAGGTVLAGKPALRARRSPATSRTPNRWSASW
ncbi:MAG: hypothetical protein KY454_00220 [Actinobacteria bacterium]|nr:hypothetical protein [Actinomycetota bacterium]MBW3648968.1 hypothetical protein [Actinomycetota bacterium]